MTCSNCGTQNSPGRKFCGNCGQTLALACPACGSPNEPGMRFCGECGSPLVGDALPVPLVSTPSAHTAERRLVTVLFADLVGFTALSEGRDSEEVRDLLSRYFDTCRSLASRYGGTIEKFIGDAVMAVWGTPIAQEDDAERAVRAALELTQAVADLGNELGAPDLKARAGVLTGEAAVTIGAEGQGMVAGDLVNTASRIQSVAVPGAVYFGAATKRFTEASIVYEGAGTHELKGKVEPLALWRAVRIISGVRGALRSAGLEPPFVGRDRELRLVKELFHASAEGRSAHLVSVVGIAGIGKSRLSWEFFKYIDGLAERIWWHRGRCLAYGEGVTYWALAEMVRMRARIDEGEEPSSALAKLHAAVDEHVPDPEERRLVRPRLGQLLSLEEHPGTNRDDLFSAWRLFFERLADRQPVLMVFEDMQWADRALLDFIEYLLEWSRHHPIYILTLARPELAERHPQWAAAKRNSTSLYLEPLSERAMQHLLSGLVPGLPDKLHRSILERAEGVPLYAVETVRMLLDRGLLEQVGNEYRPTGPITALDVPETLHALIAARLDGLSPDERALVQDASVIGKTFARDALGAVSGRPADELDPILTALVRKEVLSFQTDPRSLERGQYGFLQDLLKLVAYETLSKRDRKARHLAVAAHLLQAFGDEEEVVEVVASHYLDAYRSAPEADDAAGIRDTARGMLTRAGERAASLAANEEAQRYFEQALELADDPSIQAPLHERAGGVAWAAGRSEAATGHLEAAIELFNQLGQTHPAARVSAALAEVIWNQNRGEEAIARMRQALAVLADEEPDADVATLAAQLARFEWLGGQNDEAVRHIEFALTLAERFRLNEVLSMAFNTKGLVLRTLMRPEEAVTLVERALQIALDNNLSAPALRAYNNLVAFLNAQERHEEEFELCQKALALARKVGNRPWELQLSGTSAAALVDLGRWDEALARAEEVLSDFDVRVGRLALSELWPVVMVHIERGDRQKAAALAQNLEENLLADEIQSRSAIKLVQSRMLHAEERHAEGLAVANEALTMSMKSGLDAFVARAFAQAAECAWSLGDEGALGRLLDIAGGIAPGGVTPFLSAQAMRFNALVATRKGDEGGAENEFKGAAGTFRELSMPFWLAVVLTEHGEQLVGLDRRGKAEPMLAEAREIFERLKAQPWLERLDRLPVGADVVA